LISSETSLLKKSLWIWPRFALVLLSFFNEQWVVDVLADISLNRSLSRRSL
jgi:hypothetical protein